MYCSNCGSQLKETDIFCSKCGHKQGDENKEKEPPKEEVVFNPSSQKGKPVSFSEQDNFYNNHGRENQPPFKAPIQAHQSVNNAKRPVEDDFVWNVHNFPEAGPRATEDIDFRWEEAEQIKRQRDIDPSPQHGDEVVDGGKFHTYNKSREEFQELLDKEYLRQDREGKHPLKVGPQDYLAFDPIEHVMSMERERKETPGYYSDSDYYDQNCKKFDTVELQKDLIQPEMDEMSKTQIIEKIKYGDETYRNQEDDFDIKKTQFVEDEEIDKMPIIPAKEKGEPDISPTESMNHGDDHIDLSPEGTTEYNDINKANNISPVLIASAMAKLGDPTGSIEPTEPIDKSEPIGSVEPTEPIDKVDPMDSIDPIAPTDEKPIDSDNDNYTENSVEKASVAATETPIEISSEKGEEQNTEKTPTPKVDERLSKLWDSDTAPVPVASLVPNSPTDDKNVPEDKLSSYDPMDDDYDAKDERRGGFIGKFVIAIIVIVLIIEGSILGLRNFAPESEVTAKANQVILTIQTWVEDTFFNRNQNTE